MTGPWRNFLGNLGKDIYHTFPTGQPNVSYSAEVWFEERYLPRSISGNNVGKNKKRVQWRDHSLLVRCWEIVKFTYIMSPSLPRRFFALQNLRYTQKEFPL